MINRRFYSAAAAFATIGTGLSVALPVSAQMDWGRDILREFLTLPEKDPRLIVAELINVVIGFTALVFVILILSAGFRYMVSGGEKEKTDKAKRAIANAVIGLALVLSAWSITTFAIDAIINALNVS